MGSLLPKHTYLLGLAGLVGILFLSSCGDPQSATLNAGLDGAPAAEPPLKLFLTLKPIEGSENVCDLLVTFRSATGRRELFELPVRYDVVLGGAYGFGTFNNYYPVEPGATHLDRGALQPFAGRLAFELMPRCDDSVTCWPQPFQMPLDLYEVNTLGEDTAQLKLRIRFNWIPLEWHDEEQAVHAGNVQMDFLLECSWKELRDAGRLEIPLNKMRRQEQSRACP